MLKELITTYKDTVMLGKVFRENKINLLYGESGCGKTISTIKALNEEGITPVLLDFDSNDSQEVNECKYTHINGYSVLKKKEVDIPSGYVIIIDTWQMFIDNGGTIEFLNKIKKANNTIVLIAHNKAIATKQDIPDIDPKYANHFGSKLFLERVISKSKGNISFSYNLHIKKCRGFKGIPVIKDWMREPDVSNTVSKLIK